jgi:hypothetical protein
MVQLVRHRHTKESATDRLNLNHRVTPRLHTSGFWLDSSGLRVKRDRTSLEVRTISLESLSRRWRRGSCLYRTNSSDLAFFGVLPLKLRRTRKSGAIQNASLLGEGHLPILAPLVQPLRGAKESHTVSVYRALAWLSDSGQDFRQAHCSIILIPIRRISALINQESPCELLLLLALQLTKLERHVDFRLNLYGFATNRGGFVLPLLYRFDRRWHEKGMSRPNVLH